MRSAKRHHRAPCVALVTLLFVAHVNAAQVFLVENSSTPTECPWLKESSQLLLDRNISAFSATDVSVQDLWNTLTSDLKVPLSFIHNDPDVKISLTFRRGTLRQLLDEIVAHAPTYRYAIMARHLVLYSRDPKWQARINDIQLGPGPRLQVASTLAEQLSRRLPELSTLGGPGIRGDPSSYVYQDVAAITGPGTVLELLAQLLGDRPSTVFYVIKEKWGGTDLWIGGVELLRALAVTAPTTNLRRRDDTLQLKVVATLQDGTRRDLTAAGCGTAYKVSDERVLAVTPGGLVSVRGPGEAEVTAWNEDVSASLRFKIDFPQPPGPDRSGRTVPPEPRNAKGAPAVFGKEGGS
jgi:hypothetical protein